MRIPTDEGNKITFSASSCPSLFVGDLLGTGITTFPFSFVNVGWLVNILPTCISNHFNSSLSELLASVLAQKKRRSGVS